MPAKIDEEARHDKESQEARLFHPVLFEVSQENEETLEDAHASLGTTPFKIEDEFFFLTGWWMLHWVVHYLSELSHFSTSLALFVLDALD